MSRVLKVIRAGPGVTVQDRGRPGYLDRGLSRGGAVDRIALAEGAALLDQPIDCAALELAGGGGEFAALEDLRIALTGAPMNAEIGGVPARWAASHLLRAGETLMLRGMHSGSYAYLHVGGGIATPKRLGSRSCHVAIGLGPVVEAGDHIPIGPDTGDAVGRALDVNDRFSGGDVRIVAGFQTGLFAPSELRRFEATEFKRDIRSNRMGVRLTSEGDGFATEDQLNILSEAIVPGDIQMTGSGAPYMLMPECQTTGGYPRIGSVLPSDLPIVAQAPAGAALRFGFVSLDEAMGIHRAFCDGLGGLAGQIRPLIRDPRDIPDLLSYQLISGVASATET